MEIPDIAALHPSVQPYAFLAVLVVGALMAFFGYKRPSPPPTQDMVIAGASIADMKPVRDIADSLQRLAQIGERLLELAEQEAIEAEYQRRLDADRRPRRSSGITRRARSSRPSSAVDADPQQET